MCSHHFPLFLLSKFVFAPLLSSHLFPFDPPPPPPSYSFPPPPSTFSSPAVISFLLRGRGKKQNTTEEKRRYIRKYGGAALAVGWRKGPADHFLKMTRKSEEGRKKSVCAVSPSSLNNDMCHPILFFFLLFLGLVPCWTQEPKGNTDKKEAATTVPSLPPFSLPDPPPPFRRPDNAM